MFEISLYGNFQELKQFYIFKNWIFQHMKILIPMAGRGKRFDDAGYSFPKPLIDINGKTMIQVIVENLNFSADRKSVV